MEALTDADENKQLDDGAVEIGSDEEYHLISCINWLLQNCGKSNINLN